jgi:acyl-CoA thioesterase
MDSGYENIKNDRFAKYLGINLIEIKPGYAKVEMEITENHLNGIDIVQGGAIFTLADYAFAAASNMKHLTVGINANISYYKSPTGRKIIAEANEISKQNKICGYAVDVFDENYEIIAHVSAMGFIKRAIHDHKT